MLEIDNSLLDGLLEKAASSERRRMNFDLRTTATCPEAALPVDVLRGSDGDSWPMQEIAVEYESRGIYGIR